MSALRWPFGQPVRSGQMERWHADGVRMLAIWKDAEGARAPASEACGLEPRTRAGSSPARRGGACCSESGSGRRRRAAGAPGRVVTLSPSALRRHRRRADPRRGPGRRGAGGEARAAAGDREIATGVALGPTLLGAVAGDPSAILFPEAARAGLDAIGRLGLVLFMFLVGLEFDLRAVPRGRLVVLTGAGSALVPFAAGVAIAPVLFAAHPPPAGVGGLPFALFFGVALSITAFPVLARILIERDLHHTRLGQPDDGRRRDQRPARLVPAGGRAGRRLGGRAVGRPDRHRRDRGARGGPARRAAWALPPLLGAGARRGPW